MGKGLLSCIAGNPVLLWEQTAQLWEQAAQLWEQDAQLPSCTAGKFCLAVGTGCPALGKDYSAAQTHSREQTAQLLEQAGREILAICENRLLNCWPKQRNSADL